MKGLNITVPGIKMIVFTYDVFQGPLTVDVGPTNFKQIEYVSLAYNDIHSLPQDVFTFLNTMKTLDLSGNPLAYIDQVTLGALTDLLNLRVCVPYLYEEIFNLIKFQLIPCHFTSFHVIPCHSTSIHAISGHFMSFNVIPCHFMSIHIISCNFMSIQVISCHFMLFHVIPAILCHFTSFHVIPCHFMPFHAISCHSNPFNVIPFHSM